MRFLTNGANEGSVKMGMEQFDEITQYIPFILNGQILMETELGTTLIWMTITMEFQTFLTQ